MLYEFQVFYRLAPSPAADSRGATVSWPAMSTGPIHAIAVRAETPERAQRLVAPPGSGLVVVSVGPGRPLLPEKPTFNLEEAAAYLDISKRTLRDLQAKGELPRPQRNGHSVFRIEELERYRAKNMRLEEWKEKGNP
jgi:excisionase family DNA binding protein